MKDNYLNKKYSQSVTKNHYTLTVYKVDLSELCQITRVNYDVVDSISLPNKEMVKELVFMLKQLLEEE